MKYKSISMTPSLYAQRPDGVKMYATTPTVLTPSLTASKPSSSVLQSLEKKSQMNLLAFFI